MFRDLLVSVRVVVVVLDPPGLKGVDDRHKHESADNVFHKLVLAEGAVTAIVANNKPLCRLKIENDC